MKAFLGVAAVSCVLQGVGAKSFKWSRDGSEKQWQPARETLAVMPALGFTPLPTEAPVVPKGYKGKRTSTDNTCAYVSGDIDTPLYCGTDSACVYNSINFKIGCCPDESTHCPIWTTCYNSAQEASYTTDNGYTMWCGDSEYPYCKTHIYKSDPLFQNYTLFGCGAVQGTDTVYYQPLTTSSSSRSTTTSDDDDDDDESSTSAESTSTSASGFLIASESDTPTSTTTVAPASTSSGSTSGGSDHKKSTPVGAIVGGVVGGVAALALIGLAIFFLLRRNRKNKQNIAPAAAAANTGYNQPPPGAGSPPPQGYPQGPQMQQQYPPPGQQGGYPPVAGFAPVDNRQSIQKPPYGVTNSVYDPNMPQQPYSPSNSPPPQTVTPNPGYSPSQATGQPFSPTDSQYSGAGYPQQGQYAAPQQPTYQTHNPQQAGFAHELPTSRPDGEVRELA